MNGGLFLLGLGLVTFSTLDMLWTALWVDGGASPLASRLASGTWHLLRRVAGGRDSLLSLAGPLVLAVTLLSWVLVLVAGWTLIFAAADQGLYDTVNRQYASGVERAYFVTYVIFTLGLGDIVPSGRVWQVATAVMSASGMLLVTLVVSYVLSVISAVVQRRTFASSVSGLASSAEAFVQVGWNGEHLRDLAPQLRRLTSQLGTVTQQHLAYPVLHHYRAASLNAASGPALAILDDALTLLRYGVPEAYRPDAPTLRLARQGVESYLALLSKEFIQPADQVPPPPPLDALRRAGIPTVSDTEFARALDTLSDRRRTLLGLVQNEARRWPSECQEG